MSDDSDKDQQRILTVIMAASSLHILVAKPGPSMTSERAHVGADCSGNQYNHSLIGDETPPNMAKKLWTRTNLSHEGSNPILQEFKPDVFYQLRHPE